MARDETKMYQAISRIENGEDKRTVAEDLDIGYATVIRWYKEYKDAKLNGTLDQLLDMDKLILATAGQLLESGAMQEQLDEGVERVSKGANALSKLQDDFVLTASAINAQIKSRLLSIEHTSELMELTECLVELQNAFFNKNMTQVNVQNNYDSQSGSKYGTFLNDKPTHNGSSVQ